MCSSVWLFVCVYIKLRNCLFVTSFIFVCAGVQLFAFVCVLCFICVCEDDDEPCEGAFRAMTGVRYGGRKRVAVEYLFLYTSAPKGGLAGASPSQI